MIINIGITSNIRSKMSLFNRSNLMVKNLLIRNRQIHNIVKNADLQITDFVNRNPRNLERMRIAYKPSGYHLEKPGKCYWHKLELQVSGRHVTAIVKHFENGDVLKASTQEYAVHKQLYRNNDTSAYINLGRVLAQRCLQSGLTEIRCDIQPSKSDSKISQLIKALEDGGVCLKEPEQYKKPKPWDQHRPDKPWEITD